MGSASQYEIAVGCLRSSVLFRVIVVALVDQLLMKGLSWGYRRASFLAAHAKGVIIAAEIGAHLIPGDHCRQVVEFVQSTCSSTAACTSSG